MNGKIKEPNLMHGLYEYRSVLDNMSELAGAKRIHLMGIGGSGMSSLARLLSSMGSAVSGCDLRHESSCIKALEALGVPCAAGHSREHLERFDPQLVIFSSAVDGDCEELADLGP